MAIVDDGIGFSVENPGRHGSIGLQGMRERAEQIGGHLYLQSQLGQGTSVTMELLL
jgi:signal transduction histidine kinase